MPAIFLNDRQYTDVGAHKIELTQLEYDALTDIQKHNGTMYFITDANGDGEQFQPIIYSEEEREIGCWIDGKPLYQKTIKQSFTGKTKVTIATDIDYEHTIETTYYATGVYDSPMFITGATVYCYIQRELDNSLTINNEYNGTIEWTVTIQYTKTTDTPGSGIWTPSGIPAVHYSTDEQVVGTWVDGSTLYEKTIDFGYLPNNTTKDVAHNISNIDKIWISEGFVYGSNGWCTFVNLPNNNFAGQWHCFVNNTYIEFWTGMDRTDRYAYVVVRYTKTTS